MEANSLLVVVSVFPRKFLLRVLRINCFSIISKEFEIYEQSGRKPSKNPQFNKITFWKKNPDFLKKSLN